MNYEVHSLLSDESLRMMRINEHFYEAPEGKLYIKTISLADFPKEITSEVNGKCSFIIVDRRG